MRFKLTHQRANPIIRLSVVEEGLCGQSGRPPPVFSCPATLHLLSPPTATAGKSGQTQEKWAIFHTSVFSQESFERVLGNLLLSVETWRKFHECDRAVV